MTFVSRYERETRVLLADRKHCCASKRNLNAFEASKHNGILYHIFFHWWIICISCSSSHFIGWSGNVTFLCIFENSSLLYSILSVFVEEATGAIKTVVCLFFLTSGAILGSVAWKLRCWCNTFCALSLTSAPSLVFLWAFVHYRKTNCRSENSMSFFILSRNKNLIFNEILYFEIKTLVCLSFTYLFIIRPFS